jgi:uncharacterized protein
VTTEIEDVYALNGCCVPGVKKNFITTDGAIHVCEKMPTNAPAIGHINTGYDIAALKKIYIDDYAKESIKDCSRCWAIRLCNLCYLSAFNGNGQFDSQEKRKNCRVRSASLVRQLADFSALLDENPSGYDHLYKIKII